MIQQFYCKEKLEANSSHSQGFKRLKKVLKG